MHNSETLTTTTNFAHCNTGDYKMDLWLTDKDQVIAGAGKKGNR
jgi:hypothetical protein